MSGIYQYFSPSQKKRTVSQIPRNEKQDQSTQFINNDILLWTDASKRLLPVLFLELTNDYARVQDISTLVDFQVNHTDIRSTSPDELLALMGTADSDELLEVYESAIHLLKTKKDQINAFSGPITKSKRKRKCVSQLLLDGLNDNYLTSEEASDTKNVLHSPRPSSNIECKITDSIPGSTHIIQHVKPVKLSEPNISKDLTRFSFDPDGLSGEIRSEISLRSIKDVDGKISGTVYPHHSLEFLQKGVIKDKFGILHSEYTADVSTVYIPDSYLKSREVTPAMRQWWKFKAEYFDTVLLFKLGKFYETYHMDADVLVEELGLIYMKGKYAHAGFPESSFSQHSSALIQKGYKVARIEQTETPDMLAERTKSQKVPDKVVTRELCSVITPGTRIFDPFDVEVSVESVSVENGKIGFGSLLCICDFQSDNGYHVGMVVLDTSIGQFYFSQFQDDDSFSHLRTMVAYVPLQVAEVILPKGNVSYNLRSYVHRNFAGARREYVNGTFSAKSTLQKLMEYFLDEGFGETEVYKCLGIDEEIEYELAMLALGCCVKYLEKNKIATRILKQRKFMVIKRNEDDERNMELTNHGLEIKYMILDHNALSNIDILVNNDDEMDKGSSLLGLLDNCCTPFGKRLLPSILSQPLYKRQDIIDRQNAIEELMKLDNIESFRTKLHDLPDLDRLLFRIHSYAIVFDDTEHPDNRAFIFNPQIVDGRKIGDLINCLQGLSSLCEITEQLQSVCHDKLLLSLLTNLEDNQNCFQRTKETVEFFKNAFDASLAKKSGKIEPREGLLPEYDQSIEKIKEIKLWLENKLAEIKKFFRGHQVKYVSFNKERYLIEVPSDTLETPSDYVYKCQRKGFKRYEDPEIKLKVEEMVEHEIKKDEALKTSLGYVVKKLASNKSHLDLSVRRIAFLDCLMSFAEFSKGQYNCMTMCKPRIVDSEESFIKIEEGYHPFLAAKSSEFVVNNIILGANSGKCGVATGSTCGKCGVATGASSGKCDGANGASSGKCDVTTGDSGGRCDVTAGSTCGRCDVTTGTSDGKYDVATGSTCGRCDEKCNVTTGACTENCDFKTTSTCGKGDVTTDHNDSDTQNNQKSMIITGPNMGGKSTVMRQVAITVILAQLGCYVPALACALTPFDRIFARLGASFDKPLNGQSTFYIELMETSSLLRFATKRSLVILDELGRGTSTYDGMAVAGAVLQYITKEIKCLMLFSTHYHYLVNNVKSSPMMKDYVFYNMFFTMDDTQNEKSVVFLYKLITGICSNSYGFNVAKLAGLPESIIEQGKKTSVDQEKRFLMTELLLQLSEGDLRVTRTLRDMIDLA